MLSRLSVRLFVAMAAVVVVALGGALVAIGLVARQAVRARAEQRLVAAREAVGNALAARVHTLQRVTQGLVQVPAYVSRVSEALRTGDRADLLDQAEEFRDQIGAGWVLLTDAGGVLYGWTLRPEQWGDSMAGGALIGLALQNAAPTEGVWIEPEDRGDALYQAVGVPIRDPGSGTTAGLVVAALPVDSAISRELGRLVGVDLAFFVRNAGEPVGVAWSGSQEALERAMPRLRAFDDTSGARGVGDDWVGAQGALTTADGTPVAGYITLGSSSAELAPFRRVQRISAIALPIGLLLGLGASLALARRVTRPVEALVGFTRRVSEGEFLAPPSPRGQDEISELTRAFARMVDELRDKQRLVEYLAAGGSVASGLRPVVAPVGDTFEIGRVLGGRYEIQGLIGAGGMGVVYRAWDRQLADTVAIKVLPSYLASDPAMLERFKREIRLARRVTHRHIVRTHDMGEADGHWFLTMEYLEGTSLDRLIATRGRLPVDVTLSIGRQICRALEVAHEAGVIHRDIKPQNLVVEADGWLKVLDFGVARPSSPQAPQDGLTMAGLIVGTPAYMPPEQLLGEELDERADIYAAGAVLFECLTGRPPVVGRSVVSLMARAVEEPVPDLRADAPEVPEAVAGVVSRCLAKRRDERWPRALDLRTAIEELVTAAPAAA